MESAISMMEQLFIDTVNRVDGVSRARGLPLVLKTDQVVKIYAGMMRAVPLHFLEAATETSDTGGWRRMAKIVAAVEMASTVSANENLTSLGNVAAFAVAFSMADSHQALVDARVNALASQLYDLTVGMVALRQSSDTWTCEHGSLCGSLVCKARDEAERLLREFQAHVNGDGDGDGDDDGDDDGDNGDGDGDAPNVVPFKKKP